MFLEQRLSEFSADLFIERSAQELAAEMGRRGVKGVAIGASGGIDSIVTVALCLRARSQSTGARVVALQMNDSRVKHELYNAEIHKNLGADFMHCDITGPAIDMENHLRMPPRWLTVFLTKLVLRWVPTRLRRQLILAIRAGEVPEWVLVHYRLLTLLHRLRIAKLRQYASSHGLMVVVCTNRTEGALGYFVEQGIDDPHMGDCAPLFGIYKSEVLIVARSIGLPERVMLQRPSPGFGGVYDDEIIGPYELVDTVLVGFQLGYSDGEIAQALLHRASTSGKRYAFRAKRYCDIRYVQFLRELSRLSARKGRPAKLEERVV